MPDTPSPFATTTELADAVESGALRPSELVERQIARIEQHDSPLNAVVARDFERARARAAEADAARERGEPWGPLHGIPITLKDTFETEGIPTTAGAPELAKHVPRENATVVQRLVDAGAIVLGKTNVPIWAGDCQSYNAVYGTTNNPWDLARTPGGSSGGAAVAVATGMSPLEIGSDIGGSIRNPAHFCGVYGLKPSWGIVPLRGHIPGPPGTLSHPDLAVAGPLARSAEDLRLALGIIAGAEPGARGGWKLELAPARARRLGDLRVAAWLDDAFSPIDPAYRARLEACVEALERAGANVDRKARPELDFEESYSVYTQLLHPIIAGGLPPQVIEHFRTLAEELAREDRSQRALQARGAVLSHRAWLVMNERRCQLRAAWTRFFGDYDVLLMPVAPGSAFEHQQEGDFHSRSLRVGDEDRPYLDFLHWIHFATMTGLPAVSAPIGRIDGRLPVGLQIVADRFEDETAIEAARLFADVLGGFEAPPGY